MNIDNIKAFLEVATTGSFQQAAKNLHITQSAMSARIKSLEDRLNRQLFIRNRNGAVLSSGGKHFMQHAVKIFRTWERARQEITLTDQHTDIVGIGIQVNHWKELSGPWCQWMETHAPSIATQLRADYSDPLMSRLRDGTLDIALIYEPQAISGMMIESYQEEELILVSTKPRSVESGSVPGYVYIDWGIAIRNQHNMLYPHAHFHRMEFGTADTALKHILANGGSGYFLRKRVQERINNNELYIVKDAQPIRLTTYLMYPADRREKQEIAAALEGLWAIKETQYSQ